MKTNSNSKTQFLVPLAIVMSLMFVWNLCRNINDVLIPHLKRACQLTDLESSLVQSAFFGAYFLVALPSGWFIQKKGYRAGIITGLLIASAGAFTFFPAAQTRIYPLFLAGLFIMASGFALLEVTASPYITKLGDAKDASSRLSFSAAIGSIGATIAPYLASVLLLHEKDISSKTLNSFSSEHLQRFLSGEAGLVKVPYLILATLFAFMAFVVSVIKLPSINDENDLSAEPKRLKHIFRFSHTLYGVGAEFFYVGAEVGIVSFIIRYAKWFQKVELTEKRAALFITAFMGLVLIGRLSGAFILKRFSPSKVLICCGIGAFMMVLMAIFSSQYSAYLSLGFLSAVGFCTSIVYPIIFSLSVKELGPYTKIGSSVFLLGIVGGAIIPPIMGYISDSTGIRYAFIIPLICYTYLIFFGLKGHKVKLQN